jgi:large subunit ribosomal protein L29
MKQQEINKLSDKDVQSNISNLSEKLMKTKLAHGVSPMENPIQIRGMRRTIARLKTELTKREAVATAKA